jgi:hypothetical protein
MAHDMVARCLWFASCHIFFSKKKTATMIHHAFHVPPVNRSQTQSLRIQMSNMLIGLCSTLGSGCGYKPSSTTSCKVQHSTSVEQASYKVVKKRTASQCPDSLHAGGRACVRTCSTYKRRPLDRDSQAHVCLAGSEDRISFVGTHRAWISLLPLLPDPPTTTRRIISE